MAKSFLDRRHPKYAEQFPHWRFLIETYEGGRQWMHEGNLFRFHKEGKEEYKARLERAFRDNITRDVIEIMSAHLMKPGIKRDLQKASESIRRFILKATKGHDAMSLDSFMKKVSEKTSAVSPCYVVVDMPALPEEYRDRELTVQETNDLGLLPYVYVVYPTDMLDFSIDEDGEFNWCLIREEFRDDSDPFQVDCTIQERFRLWTRSEWRLFVKDGDTNSGYKELDSGTHNIGAVPVIRAVHKEGDSVYTAIGLADEIAYKDRAVANNESRLDCIICDQTFSTLWIPDAGLVGSTEKDSRGRRQRMIQASTNRAALFNDKAQHTPYYLSPDASQANLIRELIGEQRIQIWEDALLGSEVNNKSTGPRTATEAEQAFEKLNSALGDKASNLERVDRRIIQLVAAWMGESLDGEQAAVLAIYPRQFNVRALIDSVMDLLQFQRFTFLGATFWKKAMERIITRFLPDLGQTELEEINQEIEDNLSAVSQLMAPAYQPPGQPQPKEPNPEDNQNQDN